MRMVIHRRVFDHLPVWMNPDSPWQIQHDDLLDQGLLQQDFPLIADFEIVLEKGPEGLSGYGVTFASKSRGMIASTFWRDRDLRKKGFEIPGGIDFPDQAWRFSIATEDDGCVYIWESDFDEPERGVLRWFKVPKEQYLAEWQQAIQASIALSEEETEHEKLSRLAPAGSSLYSIAMLSTHEGWAVGGTFTQNGQPQNGCLLHYHEGKWGSQEVDVPLLALAFASAKHGWAVGVQGALFHFDGKHWKRQRHFTESTLRSISVCGRYRGLIVGESNVGWHYNGITWSRKTIYDRYYPWRGTRMDDGTVSFPDEEDQGRAEGVPLQCAVLRAPNDGWCVGDEGQIFHFDGKEWAQMWTFFYHFNSLSFASPQEWWAAGEKGAILHYRSEHIRSGHQPVNETLYAISMLSRHDGWCFGANGIILRYNGLTWKPQVSGTTKDLRGCHMLSSQEGWCVGQDNTILQYQNGVWQKTAVQLKG